MIIQHLIYSTKPIFKLLIHYWLSLDFTSLLSKYLGVESLYFFLHPAVHLRLSSLLLLFVILKRLLNHLNFIKEKLILSFVLLRDLNISLLALLLNKVLTLFTEVPFLKYFWYHLLALQLELLSSIAIFLNQVLYLVLVDSFLLV